MIKDVKFFGEVGVHWLISELELGDLIRVQYRDIGSYESGWKDELYTGFIMLLPPSPGKKIDGATYLPQGALQMWCIETGSAHIVSPRLDKVELVSKVRK